jgi:hypothetical protein
MMFLILFGSLAAAMAISSRGNIQTAATHLHVSRAMNAAETGLAVASKRLGESASRFVVDRSNIDASFGGALWNGSVGAGVTMLVLPPVGFPPESPLPQGIAQAVANVHALDENVVAGVTVSAPTLGNAMAGAGPEYASTGWLYTPAVALSVQDPQDPTPPPSYSVVYAPLANGTDVRVIVTGYDFDYGRSSQPITRTISQDFRLVKRVQQAIVAPSRVMIGKNVNIVGDLGTTYTRVDTPEGDPALLRSDFAGLSATLDEKLRDFYTACRTADVDRDNRLRVRHPIEGAGIPVDRDYDGDGRLDGAFQDATQDGFLDEFDVFIRHYDANGDGRLALSSALTQGTPAQNATPEFAGVDDDLALLVDMSNPDRNRNGVYGWSDANSNGRWEPEEAMRDVDLTRGLNRDQVLGWRDGFIDRRDQYAKVAGRLMFRTTDSAWRNAQGDIGEKLRGPIRPAPNAGSPQNFGVDATALPDLAPDTFAGTEAGLRAAADGQSFWAQVASNLGVGQSELAAYVESRPPGSTQPRYLRLDPDANYDGRPDNWQTAHFERMPFNSPNFSDWYYRPVFENMVFRDVVIPKGLNALFINCTFAGATRVAMATQNAHVLFGDYGKMVMDAASGRPRPAVVRGVYGDSPGETSYPTMLPASARPPNQLILMANPPLDKADVPDNETGITQGYASLPDPLIIDGRRITDSREVSNNIRFHDCLIVGSVVTDKPAVFTQARNKLQFTGATRFAQRHPTEPNNSSLNPEPEDAGELAKSSLMAPQVSVDIGTFNSPQSQNVQLRGAVVAGVLDVRGNTVIDGALLLTFSPTPGQLPLLDARGQAFGNPSGFNTTIGYFGPDDGDSESIDPNSLPVIAGQRIAGWDTNNDGLFDVPGTQPQPPNSTAVPFNGYGRITVRFDPTMTMPDGLMLPVRFEALPLTYREGRP